MEMNMYNLTMGSSSFHQTQPFDRKEFNDWKQSKVVDLAPVIVLDVLYMLFGVVGNSIVCYVCYFRMPRNVINSFVMALALVELLGCVFTIPVDITEIINSYSFGFAALCKAERYMRKFVVFSSGCILIAIATERYQRIVKPYSRHVTTMVEFRCAIIGALMVSAIVAVPEAILAGNETVLTPYGKGVICSTYNADSYRHTVLPKIWGLTCVLIYVSCTTAIGAIYFAIASKIWKRNKVKTDQRSKSFTPDTTLQRRVRCDNTTTLANMPKTSDIFYTYASKFPTQTREGNCNSTYLHSDQIRSVVQGVPECNSSASEDLKLKRGPWDTGKREDVFNAENQTYRFSVIIENSDKVPLGQRKRRDERCVPRQEGRSRSALFLDELIRSLSHLGHRRHADHHCPKEPQETFQTLSPLGSLRRKPGYSRKRTTFIMFIMTLTTVFSHLPHIAAMAYTLAHPGIDVRLSPDFSVLFKIMWNSYFISLATHPFVYGFWNGRFKHALFTLFTGFSRKRLRTKEPWESISSNRES
ncbi:hypothetical protein BgiMline_035718 [Biomphalaria glabrata]|nr:cholecystokinin receptor type A-like [Biomphalaria glabrata]